VQEEILLRQPPQRRTFAGSVGGAASTKKAPALAGACLPMPQ